MSGFREIFRWEVTRAVRRPSTWVYLAVLVVIGTLSTVDTDPASTTFFNAPLNVAGGTVLLGFLGILVTAALFGDAANRDVQTGMHPLFYAAPISKVEYLGGLAVGGQNWEPVRHDGYRVGLVQAADGRMGIGISLAIP